MADPTTPTAISHFQQLMNRNNELLRKNTAAMRAAAKAADRALLNELRKKRAELSKNNQLIFDAELAFQGSNLAQSDAERHLIAQTRNANRMVKAVETTQHVLESAAKMAGFLKKLIGLLA